MTNVEFETQQGFIWLYTHNYIIRYLTSFAQGSKQWLVKCMGYRCLNTLCRTSQSSSQVMKNNDKHVIAVIIDAHGKYMNVCT